MTTIGEINLAPDAINAKQGTFNVGDPVLCVKGRLNKIYHLRSKEKLTQSLEDHILEGP